MIDIGGVAGEIYYSRNSASFLDFHKLQSYERGMGWYYGRLCIAVNNFNLQKYNVSLVRQEGKDTWYYSAIYRGDFYTPAVTGEK